MTTNKWLSNLENLAVNREVGICPFCSGNDTDYVFTVVQDSDKAGYADIWCNECNHAFHISRTFVDAGYKAISVNDPSPKPKNLKY